MPPSVDNARSPSLSRSTPKRRNTGSSKLATDEHNTRHNKKSRTSSSSLSETSPRRLENPDMMAHSTQESQKNQSSPYVDVNVDLPPKRRQNDSFLKRAEFRKEERSAREDLEVSIRSMILHSENLARSISVAYGKVRELDNSTRSSILLELAQLRTSNEAATKELTQLRISNENAAAENAKLKLENAYLVENMAENFSTLDELRKKCAARDAINIGATFVMSKALFQWEKAEIDHTASSELHHLRFENAKLIREATEIEEKRTEQILQLQSVVEASVEELSKLRSEKEKLIKETDETETKTILATQELLSLLAAANEEVKQVRSETEALLRNKDETAARVAEAAALELHDTKARGEMQLREMQSATEKKNAEIEELSAALENARANARKVFFEQEKIARQKAESEAVATKCIAHLRSENAALVSEKEKTSTLVTAEFKKLHSRYDDAVEKLKTERQATGLMKAKMQSEVAVLKSELVTSKKTLAEALANMGARDAQRAADIHRLSREKEESHAREAVLLKKLQSSSHSAMHIAFLFNCGLKTREDCNFLFNSRDS